MKQLFILMRKDLLELYRTKKILVIAAVFIIFALGSPILAYIMPDLFTNIGDTVIELPDATIYDSYDVLIQNISQVGVLAIIIAFGGLIAKEKKRGLFNTLLNNGMKKTNFITSKLKTQAAVVTIIYLISIILFSAYNYVLFDSFFTTNSALSFLALFVYLMFVIVLANFFSSLFKSSLASIFSAFGTVLLIAIFELFSFGKYMPNHLLSLSIGILREPFDYYWLTIATTFGIIIILYFLSIKLCKNKD